MRTENFDGDENFRHTHKIRIAFLIGLPHENEKIRSFYYFLGPCIQREASWFRPLTEEVPFPEPDWNNRENLDVNENLSNQENMDKHIHSIYSYRDSDILAL